MKNKETTVSTIDTYKNELALQLSNLENYVITCEPKLIAQTRARIDQLKSEIELMGELVAPSYEELEEAKRLRKEYHQKKSENK